jgi:hypothetical protein
MITEDHFKQIETIIIKGLECPDLLSEWEHGFLSEWTDKLDAYHMSVRISDKQQAIFDKIENKLKKAGVL